MSAASDVLRMGAGCERRDFAAATWRGRLRDFFSILLSVAGVEMIGNGSGLSSQFGLEKHKNMPDFIKRTRAVNNLRTIVDMLFS